MASIGSVFPFHLSNAKAMRAVAAKQALEALGTEKQAELTKHSAPFNDGQMWENTH